MGDEILTTGDNPKVLVTPTKASRSRGILLSLFIAPLGFIPIVKDFFSHNPEAATILITAWGWFIRWISGSPLLMR